MAKTFKRTLAVATLATSMVLMGGAASALSIPPVGAPGASKATQMVRNAEADADNQIRKLQKSF